MPTVAELVGDRIGLPLPGGQLPPGTWWTANPGVPMPPMDVSGGEFPSLWSDVEPDPGHLEHTDGSGVTEVWQWAGRPPGWRVVAVDVPAMVQPSGRWAKLILCSGDVRPKLSRALAPAAGQLCYESNDHTIRAAFGPRTEITVTRGGPSGETVVEVILDSVAWLEGHPFEMWVTGPSR